MDIFSKKIEGEETFSRNRKLSVPYSSTNKKEPFVPTNKEDKRRYQFVVDWQLP